MAKIARLSKPSIYQLKITLQDSRPPIWRRLQVRGDITLAKLHRLIQEAMGWYDSHLHQFIVGETYYGVPDPDDLPEIKDERRVRLDQVVSSPKQGFIYEYDFGDGWEHVIIIEKILNPESGVHYPLCLDGARACPPEDCGGIGGYTRFLKAIHDPKHKEHKEMVEWIGVEFDPEEFDVDLVNQQLKTIR
jgi:hypothetical protein